MTEAIPEHDIIIKASAFGWYVWIAVFSKTAANFIEAEAPRFGNLSKRDNEDWPYALVIAKKHDANEVRQYLKAQS